LRQLPEEAELRQVERVVARAVRDGRISTVADVAGRAEDRNDSRARQVFPPSEVRMTTVPPLTSSFAPATATIGLSVLYATDSSF